MDKKALSENAEREHYYPRRRMKIGQKMPKRGEINKSYRPNSEPQYARLPLPLMRKRREPHELIAEFMRKKNESILSNREIWAKNKARSIL